MRFLLVTAALLAGPAAAQDRVLALGGSVAEIIFDLGAIDRVIARDSTATFPEAITALPDVGYLRALSAEGVIAVGPDLIIAEPDAGPPEAVEVLTAAGIPWVAVPEAVDGAGVLARIDAVGAALGLDDAAAALHAETEASLAAAAEAAAAVPEASRRRVLFILSLQGGRIMAAGAGTSAEGIIELAGGVNAMTGFDGYKPVSDEAVAAAAPDVVLMMDRAGDHGMPDADLFALPALVPTPAGENRAVVRMDGLYLLGFGPRTGQAALDLHAALYGAAE